MIQFEERRSELGLHPWDRGAVGQGSNSILCEDEDINIMIILSFSPGDNIKLPTSELATSSQSWGWQFWVYPLLRIANPSYNSLSSLTGDI